MKPFKAIFLAFSFSILSQLGNAAVETENQYSTALGQCLADSTTGKDRRDFITWMFSSLAAHPQIHNFSNISASEKKMIDKNMAKIFTRLITEDCANQSRQVIQNEGEEGFKSAFKELGKIATQEIISNPNVDKSMGDFVSYIDENKFEDIFQ